MLTNLPDDQFFSLIFTSEDRLGMDYVEEAKRRKEGMLPFLSRVLSEEKNYQLEGEAFWGVIHAVYLLGIFGDQRGFDALVSASKFGTVYDIDWVQDVLAECYFRMGKDIVPRLISQIDREKYSGILAICSEVYALWNFWDSYPEEKEKIAEEFILENFRSISRNDPCPCGSGRKFKKCHLRWAEQELLLLQAEEEMEEDSGAIRRAVSIERSSESALRRVLARKGKTALFSEVKERCLGLIKAPQSELEIKGFDYFFAPVIPKIGFESEDELEDFMNTLMEYHNALAAQFPPNYPREGGSFH